MRLLIDVLFYYSTLRKYIGRYIWASRLIPVNGMGQMFIGGKYEIRTQTGHNCHENAGRTQHGDTSLLLYGTLIDQYDFEVLQKDDTGLGRWVTMTLRGNDWITTRVVCKYNPCKTPRKAVRSSYQQHRRYNIKKEFKKTCSNN